MGGPDAGLEYVHTFPFSVGQLCSLHQPFLISLFGSKWCLWMKSNPEASGEAEAWLAGLGAVF